MWSRPIDPGVRGELRSAGSVIESMAQTQLSNDIFDRPYLLLTPGPLSTTPTVRQAMGRDWCTWDADYNEGVVSDVRRRVELLASPSRPDAVTSTLIQGSGTAAVEATVGS